MKKSKVFFCAIVVMSLLMSSCIDIFQNITIDSNGNVRNTIKITLSKMIFEMANSFGDSDSLDYDDVFGSGDIDIGDFSRFGARTIRVDDEFDVGYIIDMTLNYSDRNILNRINEGNAGFIHRNDGRNIIINISGLGDSDSHEENPMAMAFFAASKYRLVISKKCIASISRVLVRTTEGDMETSFIDLVDSYLIEIPIILLFTGNVDLVLYST